jgi:hypothetical protein
METIPVSELLCFLVFRIPDNGQGKRKPVIMNVIHPSSEPFIINYEIV